MPNYPIFRPLAHERYVCERGRTLDVRPIRCSVCDSSNIFRIDWSETPRSLSCNSASRLIGTRAASYSRPPP